MEVFKKIFDLKPFEVEENIKAKIENQIPDNLKGKVDIMIEWGVPYNSFYIYLDPKIVYKKKNPKKEAKRYFDDKKLSLKVLENVRMNHWHLSFQKVYSAMTGEITFEEEVDVGYADNIEKTYVFNNGYAEITLSKILGEWFIEEWDDNICDYTSSRPSDEILKLVLEKENEI